MGVSGCGGVGVGEWVGAGCMECPWVSYTSPREACDLWSWSPWWVVSTATCVQEADFNSGQADSHLQTMATGLACRAEGLAAAGMGMC